MTEASKPNISRYVEKTLVNLATYRHMRVRGGYRVPGMRTKVTLKTIDELTQKGLIRRVVVSGMDFIEATELGREKVAIIKARAR